MVWSATKFALQKWHFDTIVSEKNLFIRLIMYILLSAVLIPLYAIAMVIDLIMIPILGIMSVFVPKTAKSYVKWWGSVIKD